MKRRDILGLIGVGGAALVAYPLLKRGGSSQPAPAPVADGAVVVRPQPGRRFVDRAGNLYDVHPTQRRVDFLDAQGGKRNEVGLENPLALIDAAEAGAITVLTFGGVLATFHGDGRKVGEVQLPAPHGPRDLARTVDGRLAIAGGVGHDVALVDDAGRVTARLGGAGVLDGAASVAVAANGDLYVADVGNARVAVFRPDGTLVDSFGSYGDAPGRLKAPRCVRIDGAGTIHVADLVAGCVHRFDAAHRFVERAQPTLDDGGKALAFWLASTPDGRVLYSLQPAG